MGRARFDQNNFPSLFGVSSADGQTPVEVYVDPSTHELLTTDSGSSGGSSIPAHDYIGITYPTSTSEVYTYKTGGSGGTIVLTVTVVYTDTSKENLSSVTRA